MKSNLIKDTTKEERIALIKAWIPDDDGLQDCDMDLWDIYADYINGKRETIGESKKKSEKSPKTISQYPKF